MRFLTDENWPLASAQLLKAAGHDVVMVSEADPGISDVQAVDFASRTQGILLTFDRDFGELLIARGVQAPNGIAYFRLRLRDPLLPGRLLLAAIGRGIALTGYFTVVEHGRVRQRPLPRQ